MAPEMVKLGTYDFKIDIWSLGHMLYELYTGEVLMKANSFKATKEMI